MRLLARNALRVRQRQKQLRDAARTMHTPLRAAQVARDEAEERAFEDAQAAAADAANESSARRAVQRKLHAFSHRAADEARVPPTWEELLPGHARAVHDLEGAATLCETSMVVAYRAEDPHVKHLAFLFEAYEVGGVAARVRRL